MYITLDKRLQPGSKKQSVQSKSATDEKKSTVNEKTPSGCQNKQANAVNHRPCLTKVTVDFADYSGPANYPFAELRSLGQEYSGYSGTTESGSSFALPSNGMLSDNSMSSTTRPTLLSLAQSKNPKIKRS